MERNLIHVYYKGELCKVEKVYELLLESGVTLDQYLVYVDLKDNGYIITRYQENIEKSIKKWDVNNGQYPYRGWYEKWNVTVPLNNVKSENHQIVKKYYQEETKLEKKYHVYKGGLKKKDSKPLFSVVIQQNSDPCPFVKSYGEDVYFAVIVGADVNYFQIK